MTPRSVMARAVNRVGAAALVLALVYGGSSLQPVRAQAPVYGGHFRRQLSSDPANLDPAQTNTVRAIAVKMNIFDELLRLSPRTLEIEPGAAESWAISDDRRTITFRLRRGITFHNGREMTAGDVKYSIERILAPETASPFM